MSEIKRFESVTSWITSSKVLWTSVLVFLLVLLSHAFISNFQTDTITRPAVVIMTSNHMSKEFLATQPKYSSKGQNVKNNDKIFADVENKPNKKYDNSVTTYSSRVNSDEEFVVGWLEGDNSSLQRRDENDLEWSSHVVLKNWPYMKNKTSIVYNRVPKCGSTTFQHLLRQARKINNFTYNWSRIYDEKHISKEDQIDLIKLLSSLPKPYLFDRHVHFLNFTAFGYPTPIHINLVRDPVDRFVSAYYYKRESNKDLYTEEAYTRSINKCIEDEYAECSTKKSYIITPYFCGQEQFCIYPSRKALNKAKDNIKKHFAVVGLTGSYMSFLETLSCIFPQYFKGVVGVFKNSDKVYKVTSHKDIITERNRLIMAERLALEYELYDFIKERFIYLKSKLKTLCPNDIS